MSPSHKGHRYPSEIIAYCVWLYFRFLLSFREVEEMLLQRGRLLLDGAPLVSEVWPGLRRRLAATQARAGR